MTHQQAVSVMPVALETLEHTLREVTTWPKFLLGLDEVTQTSFGRYVFTVHDGSSSRRVEIAVTPHPGEHRIAWHALTGPRFDGEIRLTAIDDHHTRVALSRTADPAGFLAGLSELLQLSHTSTAMLDLQRLEAMIATS